MATHVAEIKWAAKESGEEFLKGRFSRAHTVSFDGGTEVAASASPHVVGKWAVEAAVDPEEMLVAALEQRANPLEQVLTVPSSIPSLTDLMRQGKSK